VIARHCFHAMGTEVECLLDAKPRSGFAAVQAEFERLEALLSRFRDDSELSRLNADGELTAGPDLLAVTRLALTARERTNGSFDPTVHDAVVAAGYDRSFELVESDGDAASPGARCGGAVEIDETTIRLGPGARLDLGGIAKGYAVDRAVEILAAEGACLVNAGGDLAVGGGGLWPVAIDGTELMLELSSGALATSGRDRRRWRRGDVEHHHLIDPSTGLPAQTELLRATVAAPTAVEAEVLAKVAFLTGRVDAPHVFVTADGRIVTGGGLA
jgi:thiamine biosynthesis lipoprotein